MWAQEKHVTNLSTIDTKVLKLASRFEMLLKERQQTESGREQNESELLNELVSAYNSYRANAAIKRWQISGDQQAAIWCIIIGLDDTSRCLLRSHLDHNKWEESGIIADIGALVFCCSTFRRCQG